MRQLSTSTTWLLTQHHYNISFQPATKTTVNLQTYGQIFPHPVILHTVSINLQEGTLSAHACKSSSHNDLKLVYLSLGGTH